MYIDIVHVISTFNAALDQVAGNEAEGQRNLQMNMTFMAESYAEVVLTFVCLRPNFHHEVMQHHYIPISSEGQCRV